MRIAALSDIHGNLVALEAALDHVAQQNIDRIVIVGDVIMGASDSAECWRRVTQLNCPVVTGNTEDYSARFGTPDAPTEWQTDQYKILQLIDSQLTNEEKEALRALPMTHRFDDCPDLLFCHASPHGFNSITAYTPEEDLAEMFEGHTEHYIIRGHQHTPMTRLWGDRYITNCGSVGLPVDQRTTAQYLILEQKQKGWHLQHQSVPYDVDSAVRRFHETGYLQEAGPLARLMQRHVATATTQVSVFLRYYNQWKIESDISLNDAVDRFLMLY